MPQIRLVSLYDCSAAHSAADAKSCKTLLSICLLHLMKKCNKDTASGSSNQVTKSNSAAVRV